MTTLVQGDIDALEKAIVSGALKVRFKDHEVTYRSQKELERALELAKRQLSGGAKVTRTLAIYDGGF